MSAPGSAPTNRRQKRMGPAPFASFEDLSDELESPEDRNTAGSVVRLPGIREDATPTPGNTPNPVTTDRPVAPEIIYTGISLVGATCVQQQSRIAMSSVSSPPSNTTTTRLGLQTSNAPRIDISRASSSSHHDSRDSTPEGELFDGHGGGGVKLGLGFREEGALDLRSSTEELDYPQEKKKGKARPPSPLMHDDALYHQRKDSINSEIGLLSISGRTSRLSSIGSQGSGQSRLSNASHLSVISGQSGLSRSPSPHKMLLETSFCGTKPPLHSQTTIEQPGTKVETEVLEKVLLSRKIDPTEAVLAEGISVSTKRETQLPEQPTTKRLENHVQSVKSDITIKVDEPSTNVSNKPTNIPKKIISKSGVEYIYIPLKGPLPVDDTPPTTTTISTTNRSKTTTTKSQTKTKVREVKSATIQSSKQTTSKPRSHSTTPSPIAAHKKDDEPKYIRIKLKPDYMYSQDDSRHDIQKPDSLDLIETSPPPPPQQQKQEEIQTRIQQKTLQDPIRSHTSTPCASPKLTKHSFLKDQIDNKTPSPSLSRKSSFASIFRNKESTISPESPTVPSHRRKNTFTGILRETGERVRERSRSRSKSRERGDKSSLSTAPSSTESIDSKSKQKSVFSIFKPKKNEKTRNDPDNNSSNEILPNIEFKFNENSNKNLIKYFEQPLECDSIRIPLHSPDHYDDDKNILQELKASSQDSQETVIEAVTSKSVEAVVETIPKDADLNCKVLQSEFHKRQSSTSSENVVFSTKLGSDNEIFTTKLPKDTPNHKTNEPTNGSIIATSVDINKDVKIRKTTSSLNIQETIAISSECSSLTVKDTVEINKETGSNRNSVISSTVDDNDRYSSESERDSEIDIAKTKKDIDLKLDLDNNEPERKTLVLQQDSYDDELPYVPTTLPLERSAAVPIIPIKQRSTYEMKTCPIERPRSTTPINPSCLEEYCEDVMATINTENITKTIEKLKISLPRHESFDKSIKSPRKPVGNTWSEFAEKGISTGRRSSRDRIEAVPTPPPLPPKGIQKEWINFEEIPERRKPPKRIQTLPSRGHIDVPESVLQQHQQQQQQQQENVVYNYVNPEECKCECHEITAREREKQKQQQEEPAVVQEDELPLLDDNDEEKNGPDNTNIEQRLRIDVISDRRSVISDSSIDLSTSVEQTETNGIIDPILRTPFNSDLGVSSNRSSIVSQEEPQSPDSGTPNAFPKTL